jgi:alpha-L-fucosidase
MRRRSVLYHLAAAGLMLAHSKRGFSSYGAAHISAGGDGGAGKLAMPTPQQQAWQDLELGMFVHFAPNTWQNLESDDLSTPLSKINPVHLDTDQWARTAVTLGARYVVFVAKHQGGFCAWQTHTTDYGIRNTPWKNGKGDVLADIAASCRRFGLKLGVYVCPRDDNFGAGTGGICKDPRRQAAYDAMYREQLTEVFSRYGALVEIWFDGSTVTPVGDLIARYQPHAMVFQGPQATIRWVGNEDGFAPYPCWNGIDAIEAHTGTATALDSDPDGAVWLPNEVDVSIRRPDWFWHTDNENKLLTREQLLSIYYRSVGRGAQLLLNIPSNREGLLPSEDCAVAAWLGETVQHRFGTPLASTGGAGTSIVLNLPQPARVDTVVLEEQTALGERVRAFTLEGLADGTWMQLGEGISIGHKRIQPVMPATVSAVRFTATRSIGQPTLRRLAAFHTGVAPPPDWNAPASLWAANLVGSWKDGRFSLDLTKAITVAAQYALQFKPQQGAVTGFMGQTLELGGSPTPGLLKLSPSKPDEILLDITGLDKSIVVRGNVLGSSSGSVLLERR